MKSSCPTLKPLRIHILISFMELFHRPTAFVQFVVLWHSHEKNLRFIIIFCLNFCMVKIHILISFLELFYHRIPTAFVQLVVVVVALARKEGLRGKNSGCSALQGFCRCNIGHWQSRPKDS